MRQRHSRRCSLFGFALAALVAAAPSADAQRNLAEEGALFLLLPVGARSVGMGQAVVADQQGSEAVWWNPSAIAHSDRREAAIHHSQSIVGTGDAITLVIPSSLVGVLAASVNILDYGEQDITDVDVPGGEPIGKLIPRSFIYAVTYATPIGSRLSAGITYKILQFNLGCNGDCRDVPTFSASSSALDFGAQYGLKGKYPLAFGVAVRNVGIRLQVNDSPQSDPLPTRIQLGAQYALVPPERFVRETEVRLALDLIDELSARSPSARVGTDIVFQKRAHLRAGYLFEGGDSEGGGPAVGLGLVSGSIVFDIARVFTGLSADAGQAPTYLSLRVLF